MGRGMITIQVPTAVMGRRARSDGEVVEFESVGGRASSRHVALAG
jgi:hypothetical protein